RRPWSSVLAAEIGGERLAPGCERLAAQRREARAVEHAVARPLRGPRELRAGARDELHAVVARRRQRGLREVEPRRFAFAGRVVDAGLAALEHVPQRRRELQRRRRRAVLVLDDTQL